MKLKGQVAIITGAGRNIGEETAKLLAAEGAKIAVVDMDKGRGDRVAADISRAGGDAMAFVADVAMKPISIACSRMWCDSGARSTFWSTTPRFPTTSIFSTLQGRVDRVIAVTLTGPFLLGKYVAKQMVAQGRPGKIVNVGSTSGFHGRKRAIAYSAAKGGVANLTRAMAVQLAPHNIRVNGVVPNKIGSPVGKDEFDPTRPVVNLRGRAGVPRDMACAVLFLVSDDSDFVVGDMLFVDGGVTAMMVGMKASRVDWKMDRNDAIR